MSVLVGVSRLVISEERVRVGKDTDRALDRPGGRRNGSHGLARPAVDLETLLAVGKPPETSDGKKQTLDTVVHASDKHAELPSKISRQSGGECS